MKQLKQIKNFNKYYVDNYGNVYSTNHNRIIKLKQSLMPNGYMHIGLHKNNKAYNKYVHRLVAEAFIPNPENKKDVNHKNGIRTDNRVENLEWVSRSENQLHAYRILKRKAPWTGKFGKDNPGSKIVLQIKDGIIVAEYSSMKEAEKITGFKHVSCACLGRRKTAGGFVWKYKE